MKNELKKLTTKQLIELIKTFEHYPAVTLKDGKDYILSYLEDEACTISRKEIAEYLLKSGVEITQENIHLYYELMSDEDLKKIFNWSIMSNVFGDRIIYITDIFGWRDNKKVLKLDYWKAFDKYYVKNNDYTRFSFFGIMDTLKPIEEYISDIKNSDTFKKFEIEKQLQEEILITTKHDDFRDLLLIKETKSDGEIWFKVPNCVSSPNIDLVIEDLKNQTVKLENSCDEDEKAVLNHFKNFIKEIAEYQLKNGVVITDDNIHLYYEFMSDEQKNQHRSFISDFMANRALKTSPDVLEEFNSLVDIGDYKRESINKKTLQIILFGVKDTLKPIEEYIAEIKESEAYKSYVANSAKVS